MAAGSQIRAAARRPERRKILEDPVAELVARAGERERGVSMQALEAARTSRPSDAGVELRPQLSLFLLRRCEAARELRVVGRGPSPAFDPTRGLEARDRRDQMRARDVELGR